MALRCRDGDLAVITWDHPGCLENIGRIVMVRGPAHKGTFGTSWRIRPITEELYAFLECDDTVVWGRVAWHSRIDHPDRWMMPIRAVGRRTSAAAALCLSDEVESSGETGGDTPYCSIHEKVALTLCSLALQACAP